MNVEHHSHYGTNHLTKKPDVGAKKNRDRVTEEMDRVGQKNVFLAEKQEGLYSGDTAVQGEKSSLVEVLGSSKESEEEYQKGNFACIQGSCGDQKWAMQRGNIEEKNRVHTSFLMEEETVEQADSSIDVHQWKSLARLLRSYFSDLN